MRKGHTKLLAEHQNQPSLNPDYNLGLLLARCPILFRAIRFPEIYKCELAFWGIECEIGWLKVLERAATAIEAELEYLISRIRLEIQAGDPSRETPVQDLVLLGKSFFELKESGNSPLIPFCTGVKEVDSGLQIGMVCGELCDAQTWIRIRKIIVDCTEVSKTVCVRCGNPGTFRLYYSRRIYCDRCASDEKEASFLYLSEIISK